MKSSNPRVIVQAYRLLINRMAKEDMYYPLHLGGTEAGEGEDGRIKSSIGIGASITVICVLGVFFALNTVSTEDQQLVETQIIETETLPDPTPISDEIFFANGSPILGNTDASITLVEFGDYQCHFCNVYFKNTEHKLVDNYVMTGKVNITFKEFVIKCDVTFPSNVLLNPKIISSIS